MARVNIPSISLGPNLQKNLPAGGQGLPTTSTPGQTPSKSQGSNLRMSQGVQGGYIPDSTPRWRNVGPTLAMVGNGWQKVGISLCFEWLANWLAKCWPNIRTIVGTAVCQRAPTHQTRLAQRICQRICQRCPNHFVLSGIYIPSNLFCK